MLTMALVSFVSVNKNPIKRAVKQGYSELGMEQSSVLVLEVPQLPVCSLGLEAAVDSGVRPRTGSCCGFRCAS